MSSWTENLSARNLLELFSEQLNTPDRLFARSDDGRRVTIGEFWLIAGHMTAQLQQVGARPGDRIVSQVDKSIEALALFWACVRGGFIFLPLNTAYTMTEVAYFLSDAEAFSFIVPPEREADAKIVAPHCVVLTLDDAGQGNLLAPVSASCVDYAATWNDCAAILYTSGTTGRSKGAMLSHGNLASNALALIDLWQFSKDDVLLHALPVYHTHGLFVGMNTVLFSGASMVFHRKFTADAVVKDLAQATCFMGVPTFYTRLLQHAGVNTATTQHMRLFISGSAPLLAETHASFEERTGHAILERYGMTETSMIASNPYVGARRAGTVGYSLPHVEVLVTDPVSGQPLADGVDGMIEVRGPNVFQGYWRNPAKTAEDKRDNGFFITGDLGRIDKEGYLVISGRAKDLIITGGFNVYPKEIEQAIDALPGVVESAVIGLPHGDFGEAVTAVVVAAHVLDERQLMVTLKTQLGSFKLPKRIVFVDDLPRNAMGKVQKAELRKRYDGLYR